MTENRIPSGQTSRIPYPEKLKNIDAFRNTLSQWYIKNRRPFPWRLNPTPYRVWVSEIMLQQTLAKTVIPYYNRLLKRFPDIASLARASEEDILTLWSGLGYYSRARNLLIAARRIVEFHDGIFPTDYRTVLSLPGIGRYTAGAICSIALNQPQPIVDGNIRRVITRLMGIRKYIPEKFFWDQMSSWVPEKKASVFNQAMMELGATICGPTQPLCLQCPVQSHCRAKKENLQNSIPLPAPKQAVRNIGLVVLVLKRKGKILLMLQEDSFIPGRWGLPYRLLSKKQSPMEAAVDLNRSLFGGEIPIDYLKALRHSITNRRILAHIFAGEAIGATLRLHEETSRIRWATESQWNRMLISSLFQKVLKQHNADEIEAIT